MEYKRIAVIGISGTGKSVFSRRLADTTKLPLFYMDRLFWKGNWEAVPEIEYLKEHELLIQKETWIIEGYVDRAMSARLAAADLVLYLDYSGTRSVWRAITRWFKHRKESRPEFPKEALERFKWRFMWVVFTRGERRGIEEAIRISSPTNLKRFSTPKQLEQFMKAEFA